MTDTSVFRYNGKDHTLPKVPSSHVDRISPVELSELFFTSSRNRGLKDSIELKACLTTAYVRLLERVERDGLVNLKERKTLLERFKNHPDWYQLKAIPTDIKMRTHQIQVGQEAPPKHAPSGPRAFAGERPPYRPSERDADAFLDRIQPSVDPRRYRPGDRARESEARARISPPPPLRVRGCAQETSKQPSRRASWTMPPSANRPIDEVTLKWFVDVFADFNQKLKSMNPLPWSDILLAFKEYVQTSYGIVSTGRHISNQIGGSELSHLIPTEVRQEHLKMLLKERPKRAPSTAPRSAPQTPSIAKAVTTKRPLEPHSEDDVGGEEVKRAKIKQEPPSPNNAQPAPPSSGPAAQLQMVEEQRSKLYSPSMPDVTASQPGFTSFASTGAVIDNGSKDEQLDLGQISRAAGLNMSENEDKKDGSTRNETGTNGNANGDQNGSVNEAAKGTGMNWQAGNSIETQHLSSEANTKDAGMGQLAYRGPGPNLAPLLQRLNSAREATAMSSVPMSSGAMRSPTVSSGFSPFVPVPPSARVIPHELRNTMIGHSATLSVMLRNIGREMETLRRAMGNFVPDAQEVEFSTALTKMDAFYQAAVAEGDALRGALWPSLAQQGAE